MIVAITQARMSSTRLSGKVLMEINGKTLLDLHIKRVKHSRLIQKHIIAISDNPNDDILEKECIVKKINYFRGNEMDVLDRFYSLAKIHRPDIIVRLTADCPLIDSEVIDNVINVYKNSGADYVSNTLAPTFPDGIDVEVFSFVSLERAWKEAILKSDREHVTPYIWRNSTFKEQSLFVSQNYAYSQNYSQIRLTVDEQEDFNLIEKLISDLGEEKSWLDYANYIKKNKLSINSEFSRNEGYIQSLKKDQDDNKL